MVKRALVAVVLVAMVAMIALTGCGKSHPKNTVSDFLTLVQKGDYAGAYELMSTPAKTNSTLDAFTKAMQDKDANLGKITKFEYKKGFLGAEQSSMTFSVTRTKDGKDTVTDANFGLMLEKGKWRVTGGF